MIFCPWCGAFYANFRSPCERCGGPIPYTTRQPSEPDAGAAGYRLTASSLREIIEGDTYQRNRKPLSFAVGRDAAGNAVIADLEEMPHMLIAGTTGSGKSVLVHAIVISFLLKNTPDALRLVLMDPRGVELTKYNGVPHLLGPVVVQMERGVGALQWMTREMDKRYDLFARAGARNITDYNAQVQPKGGRQLQKLVTIIDELADLMMFAPDEAAQTITRLAQAGRAAGIHLILTTQRASADLLPTWIRTNFPARIAFAVASGVDSRLILDQTGAERLLGKGDMLYRAPGSAILLRVQGVLVSDDEIQRLVEFWRSQAAEASPYAVPGSHAEAGGEGVPLKQAPLWEVEAPSNGDPLYEQAVAVIRREGRASVSMLQRKLRIGYTRAARLIDTMEEKGIVSAPEGGLQDRRVLDFGETESIAEE